MSESLPRIVGAFERIDLVAESAVRTRILGLVELELQAEDPSRTLTVVRFSERRMDLVSITEACLRIPGGVRALRAVVILLCGGGSGPASHFVDECDRAIEREPGLLRDEDRAALLDLLDGISMRGDVDVPALFAEATGPAPTQTTVALLHGAVRQLERRGTAVHLFRFLELVSAHSTEADAGDGLRAWIDAHLTLVEPHRHAEVIDLRRQLAGRAVGGSVRTSLLVRVEPLEDETYSVLAWLGQTDSVFGPNLGPEDVVTLPELQQWLRQLIHRYAHGALHPQRRPMIEFILPSSHFNEPVDTWQLLDGQRLGVQYQVTVRPMTRSLSAGELLNDRWKTLVAGVNAESPAPDSMCWVDSTVEPLPDELVCPPWAWLAVTCPLISTTAGADALLDTGAPVAAWLRGSQPTEVRRTVLAGLGKGRLVTQLPDAVRKFREYGWRNPNDHRRDLVLLWDDPTRPPPPPHPVAAPQPKDVPLT
ncbi:VMAP-C domain-containing protein [Plantactinospora endophytica]|uniref:VMAP-C domain-containing protein n=1 Tax=Plantactinospora endophytica TaxID=673535 RepID=UPI001941F603|nr:hypothetical protein [Plantactinospora endophytica]